MAQIEVTEESVASLVEAGPFAAGALLTGQVRALAVTGTTVQAVVDGVRVSARMSAGRLDGTCECPGPAPCGHAVAAVLAWVRSAVPADDVPEQDEVASLLAGFAEELAEPEPDPEYLDELSDDLEDLLDREPLAAQELADQVMNLLEARHDTDLRDVLERVEEIYLEARAASGTGPGNDRPPGRSGI